MAGEHQTYMNCLTVQDLHPLRCVLPGQKALTNINARGENARGTSMPFSASVRSLSMRIFFSLAASKRCPPPAPPARATFGPGVGRRQRSVSETRRVLRGKTTNPWQDTQQKTKKDQQKWPTPTLSWTNTDSETNERKRRDRDQARSLSERCRHRRRFPS